jgi:hypothetical protein
VLGYAIGVVGIGVRFVDPDIEVLERMGALRATTGAPSRPTSVRSNPAI